MFFFRPKEVCALEALQLLTYDEKVRLAGQTVACYTKETLEQYYPRKSYKLVGETCDRNRERETGRVHFPGGESIVSAVGSHNRLLYKRKGYLQVGKSQFVMILASRGVFLLRFALLLLIAGAALAGGLLVYFQAPVLTPDYPLPPEDTAANAIPGDDTQKAQSDNGGGSVTIRLNDTASIDLASGTVTMWYQNPNASNQDSVITLVLTQNGTDYPVARSGLVKTGHQVQELALLPEAPQLAPGVYTGKYLIDHYNPDTGEKAVTNSEFTDIEVTVR